MSGPREVRAPRGPELSCRGWQQEAALRMLMNNLDPDVAERPDDLVVYGGTGRAARSWEAFDAIVGELRALAGDETLLVQSGKPVGVVRTHEWSPRVLIANSNLVGEWANWDEFRRLEREGLTMYGQMTAGSWIYIGTQGIPAGHLRDLASPRSPARRFDGTLAGTITLTAGLGGMGGAQPLAVTMNDGVALCVEVDPPSGSSGASSIGYLDERRRRTSTARWSAAWSHATTRAGARSIGRAPSATRHEVVPELLDRGFDGRRRHRPDLRPRPAAVRLRPGVACRPTEADLRRMARDPDGSPRRARARWPPHCFKAMVGFKLDRGAEVFDYGNSPAGDEARLGGFERAFDYPGFVPAYIRPLFCEGKGPVPVGGALG